jgi:hypothetical protein
MLELAGVKSWADFMRDAASLGLEVDGKWLKITPYRNLGPKEGFEPAPERAIEVPVESSPAEIGAAIDEALTRCE